MCVDNEKLVPADGSTETVVDKYDSAHGKYKDKYFSLDKPSREPPVQPTPFTLGSK